MAGAPPFDLSKFNLDDPETRDWVKSNFAMDDPETKAHLEQLTTPKTDNDIIVPGTGAQSFYPQKKPGVFQEIGDTFSQKYKEAKGERVGLDNDADFGKKFIGDTSIPNIAPARLLGNVLDMGAAGGELLDATLQTAFHELGNGQSGSIGGFLEDLMNMSGGEASLAHGASEFRTPKGDLLSPEVRAAKNAEAGQLLENGATRADFDKWTDENGMARFGPELDAKLKERDDKIANAQPTSPQFTRAEQIDLPMEEQHNLPFERPTPEEANLKAQADEFVANRQEPDLDFRQRELDLQQPPEQLKLGLDEPVAKPVHLDEETPPSQHVSKTVDQVNDIVGDWKDAPEILVHDNFKGLKDVDPDAVGATMPDGKVYINASKVDSPDKLSAVVYHEALGHNGMTKMFGDDLDSTLTDFYNSNHNFRADVDKWINENPTSYTDEGSVARAADEVLAEMSENGRINPTLMNKLKNTVKNIGRKMGLKLEYSDREIETILGMAHDAVIKGKKSVSDNGFSFPRYMQEASDRRSQIKAATERLDQTKKGETKTTQPFPESEPDYWRFRHVTQDGKEISGFYNIEDGALQDFNINSKAGPSAFGPRTVRQVARDLLKEHPEAKRINGYRISGARIKGAGKSPFDAEFVESGARFMRDRKKFLTTDGVSTPKDVNDLLDFTAQNLEKDKVSVPDEEIRHIAEAMNLSPSSYLNSQGFVDKKLAARILAGKQIFTNMSNDIEGLAEKLRAKWTPALHAEIRQKLAVQQAVAARLDKDTGEVARALRIQREITQARQSPRDLLRYMSEHTDDALSTPEGMNKFLEGYERIGSNAGPEAKAGFLRDATKKGHSWVIDLLNVPRTFRSSFDLSAPFRQGLFLIGTKEFYKSLPSMIKAFGSEEARTKVMSAIHSNENYPLMLKGNLSITRKSGDFADREEAFMSKLAGSLPGIKHSERAYTTYLDKLRADTFNRLIEESKAGGVDFTMDAKGRFSDPKAAKYVKDISTFVNNATGRGDLGSLNGSAQALANVFYSPRLTASRVNMFGYALKPSTYTTLSPVVRKEILKSYLALGGSAMLVYGLAKAGGANVENDPRSSDFGKLKVGHTRYGTDLSPYITLAARLASNQTKPLSGDVHDLGGKYGEKDAWDLITTFERNKLAPVPGAIVDARVGKNVVGEKVTPGSAVANLFVPMFAQDMQDVLNDNDGDVGKSAAMSVPGLLGFSMQTFDETKKPDGTPRNK